MEDNLKKIDWSFRSDVTDKFRIVDGHTYREVYEDVLTDTSCILELGTAHGGFVSFCKEQLGDQIFYVGADIQSLGGYNNLADRLYHGDVYSEQFLQWVRDNKYSNIFDLVIDDGPHSLQSQLWTMNHVEDFLSDDGVFICEDVMGLENAETIKSASPFPKQTQIWDGNNHPDWIRGCRPAAHCDNICVIVDRRRG